MRDDVLMRLSDRVMSDAGFRAAARADLDGALRAGGFELSEDELAAVREFHRQTADLDDGALSAAVADPGRRRQFGGA